MMRPALRATRRPWPMACPGATCLALAASGCRPPGHAAVVRCSGSNLADINVK